MNISKLKGIGEQTSHKFAKLGITDTDDLLLFYPRGYETFREPILISDLRANDLAAVHGVITESPKFNSHAPSKPLSVMIADEVGNHMKITWFHSNYLASSLKKSYRYVFRGRVSKKGSMLIMTQPQMYTYEEYCNILRFESMKPIYHLTEGLHQSTIAKAIEQCFETGAVHKEFLPDDLRNRLELMDYHKALYAIHFPKNADECAAARKRLVFDEFFLFSLGVRHNKSRGKIDNHYHADYSEYSGSVLHNLGFPLTNAQKKVYEEIHRDFMSESVANRLIQGDVGSGKTILAILAMLDMAYSGFQSVLMAPTEVLAVQHFEKIEDLIIRNGLPIKVALLTGSVKESQKAILRKEIEDGTIDLVIGTHAVITEKVKYHHLGLVITDEQHRFGVNQREALYNKGSMPHVLVMSATPIPRSLAVILYGDLDISIVDEKPAQRLPIKNCIVDSSYRPNAYRFITNEVHAGHQVYIICAMAESTEEKEENEPYNVVDYSAELREVLEPGIRIAFLHGQMKPADKARIMEEFASHEIDVLVSTTVIEVGIDVPNATVIMIENAERFGLATLHQLRGRVGRGSEQSYCILCSDSHSERTKERLGILKDSNDGFYISECDLKLRGPGDILGTRQSGDLGFSIGDIYADASVLTLAAKEAESILNSDPELSMDEHASLAERMNQYMERRASHLNI